MRLSYRQARRAHAALQELSAIRDGGVKQSDDGQTTYVGRLVLPRRAKMRVRAMLRVLEPITEDLTTQEREQADEAGDLSSQDVLRQLARHNRELLDSEVVGDVPQQRLAASDLGDDAMDHISPSLLIQLGPLFEDDEDTEDGAGDPRNREEKRAGV